MSQKYTVLQHITEPFYVVNCPVLMLSHALTKDNQNNSIFIQCKFENLGKKTIKAMSVQVKCFDISNMPLFNVDKFSYLDISIKQHQIFGDKVPIILPNNETRNFFIVPLKILFDDNSIWENNSLYPFQSLEIKKPLISELGELEEEYRRELNRICMQSSKHHYLPIHKGKYIICGCGRVFLDSEDTCPSCDIEIKSLFNLMDINKLQSNLEQFKKSEAQKREQEFLHSKKQKRVKTNIIIAFTLFCVLFVGLSLGRRAFISFNYSNALENAQKYKDVISVGDFYTLGTKNDGTVVATGYNEDGQCNVQEWENVLSVFATRDYAMGLKKDGTVYASGEFTGLNGLDESDHQEMLHWTNITTLSVQTGGVAGLKENGSIVECGMKWSEEDIEKWNDIVDIFAGNKCIIGLSSDGTIETTKYSMQWRYSKYTPDEVKEWNEIEDISIGENHVVGLKKDGTVVAVGDNQYGQCDVSKWENIISISAGNNFTLGLQSNGKVIATGSNSWGQCNTEQWRNIIAISAGSAHSVGLKKDGTVVATGDNKFGQCDVSEWELW